MVTSPTGGVPTRRIVPVSDWAPAQENMLAVPSTSSGASAYSHDTAVEKTSQEQIRPSTAFPSRSDRNPSNSLPWRRRPKSLLFLGDFDTPVEAPELATEDGVHPEIPEDAKHGRSLSGRIRRASLTLMRGIVRRDRRSSEPASDEHHYHQRRPSTAHAAWHKLRQAASFRNPRNPYESHGGLETIYSPLQSSFPDVPVPGNGLEPPIIPHHTGAAAKAAAAAQNEYLAFSRQRQENLATEDSQNDRESGIGIVLSPPESEPEVTVPEVASIVKVDFISQLPLELAVQILAQLDAAELAIARRVSKAWSQVSQDQQIWRQSFLREKTHTYATSGSVQPGVGLGVPAIRPGADWQKIYRARQQLDKTWKDGKPIRPVYLNGHLDSIYCLQFDESKIITGSRDKTIRIWDMHTYECRLVIGPPEVVSDPTILFDANGKPVHYAMLPNDQRTNASVPSTVSFPLHHKASILCLQYDENILVTGSSDSSCIVYNMRSGYRPVRRLQFHSAAVLDLAFDEKHIVTCSKDITICVWDRETGTLLKQLKGHTGPVNAVQMRGNTIVSCSGDFRVKLWNIDTGKNIREFVGHTKGLACSQFSEDGRYIASAGSDKVIRIWDANTGECIREMHAHESLVRSLHIDSVSGRLISGSYDTDIKVFDMETGQELLTFPGWHASWVLSAKCDYRRIVSTGQDPKILILDFGADVKDIGLLESATKRDVATETGFI